LIKIADELGWFPQRVVKWDKRTTIAGFAHEIRKLRNFVHPGVWAAERSDSTRFNKATFEVAYEICAARISRATRLQPACLTQFRTDQIDTPNSLHSSGIARPARTSCTICYRNSTVYLLPLFDMMNTSLCDSDVSTKPGRVQFAGSVSNNTRLPSGEP